MYDVLRCVIAFLGTSYLALGVLGIALVGTGNTQLSTIAARIWAMSLAVGIIIAIIPKPRVLPVVISALPHPALVQVLLIGGVIEAGIWPGKMLWITLPATVYGLAVGPILARVLVARVKAEPVDGVVRKGTGSGNPSREDE